MPSPSEHTSHIDSSNTRPVVKVSLIAAETEHLGMTPDEIVDAHPHLTLAAVQAALAYFYDHQDEIRAEWHEARDLIAELRHKYPTRPAAR